MEIGFGGEENIAHRKSLNGYGYSPFLTCVMKSNYIIYCMLIILIGFHQRKSTWKNIPDDWVDVIGFDIYQRNSSNEQFSIDLDRMLSLLEEIATTKNKIPALTEFGGNTSDKHWWTGTFLTIMKKHRISYVLGWRNAGRKTSGEFEYYVPYKEHPGAEDFRLFDKDEGTLFGNDLSNQRIYERLTK